MTESDRPRGPERIRTSDAERERVAEVLRAAMGEGRLTLAEGEERLAAAYAATYRDELTALTADLPGHGRAALARTPQIRAEVNRRLRWHGARLAVVAAVLTGLWALSGARFFWPAIPLLLLTFVFLRRLRWARYGGRPDWSDWSGWSADGPGGPGGPGAWRDRRHHTRAG